MNARYWIAGVFAAALWTTAGAYDGPGEATPREIAIVPTEPSQPASQAEVERAAAEREPEPEEVVVAEPVLIEGTPESAPAADTEPLPAPAPAADTEVMSEPAPASDTEGMQDEPSIEEPPAAAPVTDPLAPQRVIGTEGFENRTTDSISEMDSDRGNSISEMQADDGNRISEMDEDRGNRISGM